MQEFINLIKEFDGIIGAILGSIIGSISTFIATDILKRKGKLNFYLMEYEGEYWYFDNDIRGMTVNKNDNCDLSYYKVNFAIDVYNSSELPKIMRNIKIRVYEDKKFLRELVVKDSDSKRMSSARCVVIDNIKIFNLNAKESYNFNLEVNLPKEIAEKLKDGLILKLNYKDEKNKDKYFEIFNGRAEEKQ